MKKLVFLTVLLVALGATAAFGGAIWDLGVIGGSSGMAPGGGLVACTSGGTAYIWTPSAGLTPLSSGASNAVAVTWKGSSVVVAGKVAGVASRWDGNAQGVGTWTTLPLSATTTAWTPTCIAATTTDVVIGGYGLHSGSSAQYPTKYQESLGTTIEPTLGTGVGTNAQILAVGLAGSTAKMGGYCKYTSGSSNTSFAAMAGTDAGTLIALGMGDGRSITSCYSQVRGMSADGGVAVGYFNPGGGLPSKACYWTSSYSQGEVPIIIPYLAGSGYEGWEAATAVSANGRYILGTSWLSPYGDIKTQRAFIYDKTTGTREWLDDILTAAGVDLSAWTQLSADSGNGRFPTCLTGVSDDGRWFSGYGVTGGVTHGWVAYVPEPGSISVLAAGLLGLIGVCRRKR